VGALLFKRRITVSPWDHFWKEQPEPDLQRLRRDLTRAYLAGVSVDLFADPPLRLRQPQEQFPFLIFIESLAAVSSQFQAGGRKDPVITDLLANSFLLIARQRHRFDLQQGLSRADATVLLKGFALSNDSLPIFDATSPIRDEANVFLETALLASPTLAALVSEKRYSNGFIRSLLATSEVAAETRIPHIRTVLLSNILHIVAIESGARIINETAGPAEGSFADLVLNTLVRVCPPKLWAAAGRIFHAMAPFLSSVSVATAKTFTEFFKRIVAAGDQALGVYVEGFALLAQTGLCPTFLAEIVRAKVIFAGLETNTVGRIAPAAQIIARYVGAVEQQKAAGAKLQGAISKVDVSALFSEIVLFARRHDLHTVEGLRVSDSWVDDLVLRRFERERVVLNDIGKRKE
jgi:hypothetical protein